MNKKIISIIVFFILLFIISCVKDRNFDAPKSSCTPSLVVNATYTDVKNLYVDETIQIQEDLIIEGYVVSADKAGNFFSVLHFQDKPSNPDEGFQIEMDLRDSHLLYPIGSKIFINLKGLYLGKSKEVFKIGGTFTSFGNVSVGRLPSAVVDQHVFVSCEDAISIEPKELKIQDLQFEPPGILVRFSGVEILEDEIGLPFAREREETERTILDCSGNEIILVNSGFSDFQSELLPDGNGSITGVLLRDKNDYQLSIRSLDDLSFEGERCDESVDEFTSTQIFISELADPDNNSAARFVELYNSNSENLNLKGWALERYTNDNTEISSSIDLSEFTIKGESTFVISPNTIEFEKVYGFVPDMGVRTNSPADSNGDDNLQLVDPFGVVIDVFGVVGEDGSNTNHEFEDGRAGRNVKIKEANPVYTFSEWRICNDTGANETTKEPKNAPDDFRPGERN